MNDIDASLPNVASLCEAVENLRDRPAAHALASACLARVDASAARFNGFVRTYPARALERAAQLDQRAREGLPGGPLHGIPVAHKDMFFEAGLP
ncbi:MAG: hypothetical protein KGQ45_18175, partial [Burkholderiales bacterium]|nr:hypothetical protein [Burkholderiales bacterium]